LEGSEFFDELRVTSYDLEFVNFKIYPKGIVARFSKGDRKRGLVIKKEEIKAISIITSILLTKPLKRSIPMILRG
jgi:hypothetical protein